MRLNALSFIKDADMLVSLKRIAPYLATINVIVALLVGLYKPPVNLLIYTWAAALASVGAIFFLFWAFKVAGSSESSSLSTESYEDHLVRLWRQAIQDKTYVIFGGTMFVVAFVTGLYRPSFMLLFGTFIFLISMTLVTDRK